MDNSLVEKSIIDYFETKFNYKVQTLDFRFPVETLETLLKQFYKDYEHTSFLVHGSKNISSLSLKKLASSYILQVPVQNLNNEHIYIGLSDLLSFMILFDEPANQNIKAEASRFFITFEPVIISNIFNYFYKTNCKSLSLKEKKLLSKLKDVQKDQVDPHYINKFQEALLINALNENNKIKHAKVAEAISFTDEAVIITDLAGNVKEVNRNFEQNFNGFRKIKDLLPAEIAEKAVTETLSMKKYQTEVSLTTKNGKSELMLLSSYFLNDDLERPNGFVFTLKNISDLKRLDYINKQLISKLREKNVQLSEVNKRLVEADKIKTDLLSVVSHELKTPLSTIIGFSELLASRDNDQDSVKRFASQITSSASSLDKLINDYLDVATNTFGISAGSLSTAPLNLKELIEVCYKEEASKIKGQDFQFEVNCLGYEPVIFTEMQNVKKLISNLINNSLKFSPNAGKISAKVLSDGEKVTISIADQGIGLTSEQAKQVFEPFYRADNSITREFQGIGLGLAICKKIVELYGGSIWCEPGLDLGTVFYVTLPVNPHKKALNIKENSSSVSEVEVSKKI